MHALRAVVASFALVLMAFPLVAQARVWVVDAAGGPGSQFTDLAEAITAASRGDVLRVRAGSYGAIQVTKALSIFGEPGASLSRATAAEAALLVDGIPTGDQVSIAGFDIGPLAHVLGIPILVRSCGGTVFLDSVHASRTSGSVGAIPGAQAALRVESCGLVVLSRCRLVGPPPIFVTGSTVVLNDMDCRAPGLTSAGFNRTDAAVFADASTVVVSRGTFHGGDVAFAATTPIAGPALSGNQTTFVVHGGATLRAGTQPSKLVSAIDGNGVVTLDPSVTLLPSGGASPVAAGFAVTTANVPSLKTTGARIGGLLQLHLLAAPNDAAAVVLGFLATPLDIGLRVPLMLDPALPTIALPPVAIGATGDLTIAVPVPHRPELLGFRGAWQAIAGTAARGFSLSNADAYVH
jgi:hypothetical protein